LTREKRDETLDESERERERRKLRLEDRDALVGPASARPDELAR
jgi:hypothetical protein